MIAFEEREREKERERCAKDRCPPPPSLLVSSLSLCMLRREDRGGVMAMSERVRTREERDGLW